MNAEVTEADDARNDEGPPRFYPFPLRAPVEGGD
jgi:hypothetical protein